MNDQLKKELQRMGVGWFILKYALDRGIKIGTSIVYGKATSQKNREAAYERTKREHWNMICDLAETGFKNNVTAGDPALQASEIRRILALLTSGTVSPTSPPSGKTSQLTSPSKKSTAVSVPVVQKGVPRGADDVRGNYIRYADNVRDSEMVPGLLQYLEGEYERIWGFAYELGNREKIPYIHELERIPVVLSKKIPADKCYQIDYNALARMVKNQIDKTGKQKNPISENQIKDILQIIDRFGWLNRIEFTDKVIGRYFHSGAPSGFKRRYRFEDGAEPYIEIYFNNISCDSFDDYRAKVAQCLAHEFFHHIHDRVATVTFQNGSPKWESKAVKESLADFFSVMYLLFSYKFQAHKIRTAEDRYKAWYNRFNTNWPYACALWYYFVRENWDNFNQDFDYYLTNGSLDKFLEVLQESQNSMAAAYDILTS